ncbi:MAG: hypothetical protein IKH65_04385 [Clostridia bacterium]|nr:hypothetical protein [Clostridia bacterium]
MNNKVILSAHTVRKSTFYNAKDPAVPGELFTVNPVKPDLTGFAYPLPSKKQDYTCCAQGGGVFWYGASTGLTRYEPGAKHDFNKVQFFSAERDLYDNNVKSLLADGRNVWVLTDDGVVYIEEVSVTPEKLSAILLEETLRVVDRHGMVSQRWLRESRNIDSFVHDGHSDNDGGFTALFNLGEVFRYAVLKRERGADDPETLKAKAVATRALEAVLLLAHVHGRGNGFVARSYSVTGERIPDDGLFFKRNGDYAYCIETNESRSRGCCGYKVGCSAPIPERLRHLFTDEGFTEDDITYKGDTSSDEITLEFLDLLFAHDYLTCDDPELDGILVDTVKAIMNHIIDNGFRLVDYSGKETTWAKWYEDYFNSEMGYVDGALNAAELLFYLKATMHITGESGKWQETYDYLVNEKGYADLSEKHRDRFYQMAILQNFTTPEDIMFGDHTLASASFLGLCILEKDETLLQKYRNGFESWRFSLDREDSPYYDFMYAVACPDAEINTEYAKEFFYRTNLSRLAAGVSLIGRHDIPVMDLSDGYRQISCKLPPDERFIAKLDRDPRRYVDEDSGGTMCVETCCTFTLAYWFGRFFGIIVEGDSK